MEKTVQERFVEQSPEQGNTSGDPAQEGIPAQGHMTRENATNSDLITTQPHPAIAPAQELTKGEGYCYSPQRGLHKAGAQCGCPPSALRTETSAGLDHRLSPLSPAMSRVQGSSLSVHSTSSSRRTKSRDTLASTQKSGAQNDGCCLPLVLACLSCQSSVLLLGLLEACSSCLHSLCSSCCHGCARCCTALQEAPLEELNCHAHCHSVLYESCCEPTECLEFCLECSKICHHS